MGTPTIYRSTIIASSVIPSNSTIDLSIALIVWVNGCGGTASNSTRRRPSSFGWDRSVALPPVPSALSSSMERLSSRYSRFAIWASSLIRPSVSLTTSPGWRGLVIFIFGSCGRFEDHWPSNPATPLFARWSFPRLDYCNGLLGGAPKSLLGQLSGVMRAAARLILVLPRQSHVTSEIRTRLHWLDMPLRVQFKLCCLAFRCLHGSAPPYLAGYFTPVSSIEGRSQLRSAAAGLLLVPSTWTVTIGPRAFAVSSPAAWEQSPGRSSWP